MEGRDYFATLDDLMRFCKQAGPHGMPSTRAGAGNQQGKADFKADKSGDGSTPAAPSSSPVPPSAAALAQTAALAQEGKARAEGLNRRQRLEAVFVAAFEGDAPLMAALVKVDPSLLRAEAEAGADGDDDGATPLLVAARRGHAECVRVLLDSGPGDTIKQVNAKGRSALHAAARGDHVHVARLLVERGLKVCGVWVWVCMWVLGVWTERPLHFHSIVSPPPPLTHTHTNPKPTHKTACLPPPGRGPHPADDRRALGLHARGAIPPGGMPHGADGGAV